MPETKNVPDKQLGKGNNYREINGKFGVVNATGTEKKQLRLVPVLGNGARVLPLELVPVPEYGAQISARAPTNRVCSDWYPGIGHQSEQGLSERVSERVSE